LFIFVSTSFCSFYSLCLVFIIFRLSRIDVTTILQLRTWL